MSGGEIMSFDLNGWYDEARSTDNSSDRNIYFQLGRKAKEELFEEYNQFRKLFNNPQYQCNINKEYLTQILPQLLNGKVYVPTTLLLYINNHYDLSENPYVKLKEIYLDNGWTRSVLSSGLKLIRYKYNNLHNPELLMFEVWEFTLTYPEYSELFVEEWV